MKLLTIKISMETSNTKDLFNQKSNAGEVISDAKIISEMTGSTTAKEFNMTDLGEAPKPMAATQPLKIPDGETPPNIPSAGAPVSQQMNASMLNEGFVVFIFDIIISRGFQIAFSSMLNVTVSHKAFGLDASEKTQLEPIFAAMLARWNIDLSNPYVAFAVFGVSIYGSKALSVYESKKEEIQKIKDARKELKGEARGEKRVETRGRKKKGFYNTATS